jgi:Peptidase M1 N-terminal domain
MEWLKSGIFWVFLLSIAWAAPTPSLMVDDITFQLPKTSVPVRYDLTLTTAVETGDRVFRGFETIEIEVTQETSLITLHSRGINIETVRLFDKDGNLLNSVFTVEAEKDFLNIQSEDKSLTTGEVVKVELEFNGLLRLGTSGFYRSSYREGNTIK